MAEAGRPGVLRLGRVLAIGFRLHLKMMTRSSFDGFLNVLWPLFFATVASAARAVRGRARRDGRLDRRARLPARRLLAAEALIGVVYATLGYLFIRNAERLSLRHATLDRA